MNAATAPETNSLSRDGAPVGRLLKEKYIFQV